MRRHVLNVNRYFIYLVVLQYGELDLLVLVLDLLGSGVILLLPLLSTSPEQVIRQSERREKLDSERVLYKE